MSSSAPRRSQDTFASPTASPASNQYPFPPFSSPQTPTTSARHGRTRESTAGSIYSVGGLSDLGAQRTYTIAEAGSNGNAPQLGLKKLLTMPTTSYLYAFTAINRSDRIALASNRSSSSKATYSKGHSTRYISGYSPRGEVCVLFLLETSRCSV